MDMIISIIVLLLAIFLRGVLSVRASKIKHGDEFDFKFYFDIKHCFRWIVHLLSSALGYLMLPELFDLIRFMYPKCEDYMVLGAFAIGFAGYDFIKILENACLWGADKLKIPLREWVSSDPTPEQLEVTKAKNDEKK